MSQPTPGASRRDFLKLAGSAGAAVVACGALSRVARAADLPHIAEDDPTAAALGYKEDASKVDAAKYAQHKAEQLCSNCNFFQGSGAFAPCQLFPGKAASAKGWCAGYAKKA